MRLLLDTHILLWATLATARLSRGERACLDAATEGVTVSAVALWELRLKWSTLHASGERKGPASPQVVAAAVEDIGWPMLPLLPRHAIAPLDPPLDHRDPFDELLLVQAQVEGCRLLTRDARLLGDPLAIGG
ncbi:hypothetical protein IP88_13565 [alpha proteobacterium AAP81b]|nr:hypothetical protein IP88_13565 [alpha proteobacterium AAP81b]